MIDENRIQHMLGVARRCYALAKDAGYSEKICRNMWLMGLLHDVGYEFGEPKDHAKVGAEMFEGLQAYPDFWHICNAIKRHGVSEKQERYGNSLYLSILNEADMTVDHKGLNCSYEERLSDIAQRYGKDSDPYRETQEFMKVLRKVYTKSA